MKHLIVSLKTSNEVLGDFKKALAKARKGSPLVPRYEISFDRKDDFDRFVANIPILKYILLFQPKSMSELAKMLGMPRSDLDDHIRFLEEIGAVSLKTTAKSGKKLRIPVVEYDTLEFKLAA